MRDIASKEINRRRTDLERRIEQGRTGILILFFFLTFNLSFGQIRDSLDIQIGQMILIGLGDFNQLDKDKPIFEEVRGGKVGGVIIFEKNISNVQPKENLQKILAYTQSLASIPVFVSIDEEGGRVTRLKTRYGYPPSFSAQYMGSKGVLDTTFFYAERTASQLKELGVNMNFAPCVDVNVNTQNPVISKLGRSFSGSDSVVAVHAMEVIKAHNKYSVATVLKHFPGHGSSQSDTHLGVADVSNTWEFRELNPYKTLLDSGMVTAIMTAHIVNRSLDASLVPATLSHKIVTGLLRNFMGYDGVVVSDDLQMKAISGHYHLKETVKECILAGVDILLFANNVPDYDLVTGTKIHEMIKEMVLKGEISPSRIGESYQRIIKLKTNVGLIE